MQAAFPQVFPAQTAMGVSIPPPLLPFPIPTPKVINIRLPLPLPDGTHVAGTIGGSVFGVAKNITLQCIKVMNDGGTRATSVVPTPLL